MTATAVKFIHSAMPGAPALTGQAGSLIGLLDAVLVNGFGTGNVDSLVIAGGVATVTRSAGHPFEVGSVALIAGATVSGGTVNGERRVLSATTTTYTFDATGLSNQTATGTISHKVAPLGWLKPFAGTNLAVYKSADPASTGMPLRVDDSGVNYSRVVGYESMTDVNTGLGPFPTAAQISGGGFWSKSNQSDATVRPWVMVGDGRLFYLSVAITGSGYSPLAAFGDFIPTRSGDPYACLLNCSSSGIAGAGNSQEYHSWDASGTTPNTFVPRAYTGLGQAARLKRVPNTLLSSSSSGTSGTTGNAMPYPNYADGGLYACEHNLFDAATNVFRGRSPGFYHMPQAIGVNVFAQMTRVTDIALLPGRTLRILSSSSDSFGCWAYDVTGPWR